MLIQNFLDLRRRAQELGPKRVAVVMADDEVALSAVIKAVVLKIATPILIGEVERIREKFAKLEEGALLRHADFISASNAEAAAETAVSLCRNGEADILLTGGMMHAHEVEDALKKRVEWIAPVFSYPGEDEMRALAEGALRVLRGEEKAQDYL